MQWGEEMKVKIKSFNCELPEYLTLGKVYDVIHGCGIYVDIAGDDGFPVFLDINDCSHLNGGSWEVIE